MKEGIVFEERSKILRQLVRFGLTGGLSSLINIGVYWILVERGRDPNVAWGFGYIAAIMVGYFIHSRWSFRSQNRRDDLVRTGSRFAIVSLISFALNQFWVWLLVQQLDLAIWAPYPLVLGVTPLVSFRLNRKWVFASSVKLEGQAATEGGRQRIDPAQANEERDGNWENSPSDACVGGFVDLPQKALDTDEGIR